MDGKWALACRSRGLSIAGIFLAAITPITSAIRRFLPYNMRDVSQLCVPLKAILARYLL